MKKLVAFSLLAVAVACSSAKSSGTSGGTGTTSGGSTSGADVTVCAEVDAGGGQGELTDCNHNADCQCPASCVVDTLRATILGETAINPLERYCEAACTSSADCHLPSTVCQGGRCVEIPCGALDDAGAAADFGFPCNALDAGDGICLLDTAILPGFFPTACWLAGTATSSCAVLAPPGDAGERCAPGTRCVPDIEGYLSGGGTCLPVCDPSPSAPQGAPTCATGQECLAFSLLGAQSLLQSGQEGVCVVPGDGGCNGGLPVGQTEFASCFNGSNCACPQVCAPLGYDAGPDVRGLCEMPCGSDAECFDPATQCSAGLCSLASCSGLSCAFDGDGGGTCVSAGFEALAPGPFCVLAGMQASGQSCTLLAPQSVVAQGGDQAGLFSPNGYTGLPTPTVDQLCAPGLLCVETGDAGNAPVGACVPACSSVATCGDAGLVCYPLDSSGFGFCGACAAKGSACTLNGQCCSGTCETTMGLCD